MLEIENLYANRRKRAARYEVSSQSVRDGERGAFVIDGFSLYKNFLMISAQDLITHHCSIIYLKSIFLSFLSLFRSVILIKYCRKTYHSLNLISRFGKGREGSK